MSDSLKSKIDKNLTEISERYPNLLGITEKRKLEVDKYNQKFNLSVGIDSLTPPTTLNNLVDCSDSVLKTLSIASKYSSIAINDESEFESLKDKLDIIESKHQRENLSILKERDNLTVERDTLLTELKQKTEKLDMLQKGYKELWDQYLVLERRDTFRTKREQKAIPIIDPRDLKLAGDR